MKTIKNWAWKASKLLGDIRDLLMMDKLWDALVQQEMIMSQWKDILMMPTTILQADLDSTENSNHIHLQVIF